VTARGRLGYVAGPWLAYATGGLAWAGERFVNTPVTGTQEKELNVRLGWAAGAGVEYAFAPHWSLRLEYLYSRFEQAGIRFPSGTQISSSLDLQSIRVGLNRKFDGMGSSNFAPRTSLTDPEIRSLGNPRSNDLPAARLSAISRALYRNQQPDACAASPGNLEQQSVPERPAVEGGEVYYNPELLQGLD